MKNRLNIVKTKRMGNLINYILLFTLGVTLFTVAYLLLLRKNRNYRLTRYYFLFTILFSTISPIHPINLGLSNPFNFKTIKISVDSPTVVAVLDSSSQSNSFTARFMELNNLLKIIKGIYLLVAIFLFLKLIYRLIYISMMIATEQRYIDDTGQELFITTRTSNAFSFFDNIFINPNNFTYEEKRLIIEHEKVHITQYHTIDLIIIELLLVFHWFNPFAYTLRKLMIESHEYIADEVVLSKGYDPHTYQNLLLSVISSKVLPFAGNQFSAFIIKKRLAMIGNNINDKRKKVSFLVVIPVSMILFFTVSVFANVKTENSNDSKIKDRVVFQDTVKNNNLEVFTVVDEMPTFSNDGENGFRKFIATNLKYPKEAVEKNIQGKVFIQFIVEKDGQLSNFKVLRSAHPQLDEEALRVVKLSPKWNPGKQRGKAVRVSFTFPITFSLQNTDNKISTEQTDVNEVYTVVEEMPKYGDNDLAFRKFIAENMKYPEEAAKDGIQGKVFVQFVVEQDGQVSNCKILKSIHPLLDQEALRVVQLSPKWIPGKQRGKAVRVAFTFPIDFKLETEIK